MSHIVGGMSRAGSIALLSTFSENTILEKLCKCCSLCIVEEISDMVPRGVEAPRGDTHGHES
jgi:hypothetical protein